MKDLIKFNDDLYDVDSGLTVEEVRAALRALYPSVENAVISFTNNDNGTRTWLVKEKPGEKG